jgi:hypothetical protein
LRDLLAPCCASDADGDGGGDDAALKRFEASMRDKAARLAVTPFGEELLHVIGYVYATAGEKCVGRRQPLGLPGHWVALRQKGHVLANQAKVVGAGAAAWWSQRAAAKDVATRAKAKAATKADLLAQKQRHRKLVRAAQAAAGMAARHTAAQQVQDEADDEAAAEREAEAAVVDAFDKRGGSSGGGGGGSSSSGGGSGGGDKQAQFMVQMLEALWHMSVLDIEATLRAATHKVLHDKPSGLGKEEVAALQLRRARGLLVAGRVFRTFECADAEGLPTAAAARAASGGNSGTSNRGSGGSDGSSSDGSSGGGGSGSSASSAAAVQGGFKEFSERVQRNFGGALPAEAKKKKKTWRDQLAEQVSNGSAPGQPRPTGDTPPRSSAADL